MRQNIFKYIDLSFLSLLTFITGTAGIKFGMEYAAAGYFLSFAHLFVMIALLRWSYPGLIVSFIAIVPHLFFTQHFSSSLLFYYLLSNIGLLALVYLSNKIGIEKITDQTVLLLGYATSYFVLLLISRGVFGGLIGFTFYQSFIQNFSQMLFSMVMSFGALLMVKNIDGLLMDMTQILNRGDV